MTETPDWLCKPILSDLAAQPWFGSAGVFQPLLLTFVTNQ
jgi:hypothetical protein